MGGIKCDGYMIIVPRRKQKGRLIMERMKIEAGLAELYS